MLFSFYPQGSGHFLLKTRHSQKKTPELSGSLAYSISQAVEGFPRELKGREPTKLPMEKSQLNGTGTTGWTVGLLGQNLSNARNSSHNFGGMSGTYDSNDEIPPAKIDNLWMKKPKVSQTFTKCTKIT